MVVVLSAMSILAVSIWPSGYEDVEGSPSNGASGSMGGISYTVVDGVLTISPDGSASPSGYWPVESDWFNVDWNDLGVHTLRIEGSVESPDINTYYLFKNIDALATIDLTRWVSDSGTLVIANIAFAEAGGLRTLILPEAVSKLVVNANSFGKSLANMDGTIIVDSSKEQTYDISTYMAQTFEWDADKGMLVLQGPSYTVTFDANGGQWSEGSDPKVVKFISGETLDMSEYAPTKELCTLKGWASTDGRQDHGPNDSFQIYTDMHFRAVWGEEGKGMLTVTFDPNGGSWSLSDPYVVQCESGGTIELGEIGTPARESYTFAGWSCGGKSYPADATVAVSSDMTFTAQWKADGGSSTIVPILPGDEQEAIEVVDSGHDGARDDGRTVLVIGILVAIIAILAVMSVSEKD